MKSPLRIFSAVLAAWLGTRASEAATPQISHDAGKEFAIELLPGEFWWGGLSADGHLMPFGQNTDVERDLFANNAGNQGNPILISSKGRYLWSEMPFAYHFKEGKLTLKNILGEVVQGKSGNTLAEGFKEVSGKYFPSNGKIPDPLLFTKPQYNTWIELTYDQNEKDIQAYAASIVANSYPAGVLMIDDNWQTNYGDWSFSAARFDSPKKMIDGLHADGFKVMLWVCPFVTADTKIFRFLAAEGMLHLDPDRTQDVLWANTQNKAAIIRWWNGASAMLDLTNPKSFAWFEKQLDHLVEEYGVDGFKFDAGDADFYKGGILSFHESIPNNHTTEFGRLGLKYPLNEYRASWKMAGQPLAQRLRDKRHVWEDLEELVPGMIAQGLMGYAYTCPDMIGGGEYQSFIKLDNIDQELVVRSAQIHALMPMMQFSVAPWRVLSPENNTICRDMAKLHTEFGDEILKLAKQSSKTGEPIVKPLCWFWPESGYEKIQDQFILGHDLLVAPVIRKGARSREVVFPEGTWRGDDNSIVTGPQKISIEVPLSRLPYYRKTK